MAVELSVIIPTYQEKHNILPLLEKLHAALNGLDWEVICVDDDSPDGTAGLIRDQSLKDPRVRCHQRIGRRGLSSACIEGMQLSEAPFCAVMDADLQHDERLLPLMLKAIKEGSLDIAIGSRYVTGNGMAGWTSGRVATSAVAARFTQMITGLKVKDPLSGFFLVRKDFFDRSVGQLSGKGFKILLDLLLSSPVPPKFQELPYPFRPRRYGNSKLTVSVILDYFQLVLGNRLRRSSSQA